MSTIYAINDSRRRSRAPGPVRAPRLLGRARRVTLPGLGTMLVHESDRPSGAPTLMLLHGLGASAALNWFTSFPVLDGFHVVAPDLRGHGRGLRVQTPFTLEAAADDVAALADALRIEHFVAVGYSMGGPIAQLVWHRHRDRVAGLVLCATAYRFRATPLEQMMFATLPALERVNRFMPDAFARRVITRVSRSYLAETGLSEWAQREVLRRDPRAVFQAAVEIGRYSVRDWIDQIDVPTAVVVHARDQVVPPRRQLELASAVPGATTQIVDADHFAVIRDPERFVQALMSAIHSVTCSHASVEMTRRAS